jgi:hypothetical protein
LPVALMLIGSWADLFFAPKTFANDFLRLIGNSVIALLIATLVSFWTFGRARGFGADQILKFTNECLAPIASITLVVGAGAGFGRILMDGGVSKAIVGIATDAHLSPLILGWFVAALIRVATGSATVAMTTACGIVAPIVSTVGGVRPELMVLATGAGSLILSHVNDGGFWLVKEYFNMTVPQTFKTWTVMETLVSVLALLFTLALGDGVCACLPRSRPPLVQSGRPCSSAGAAGGSVARARIIETRIRTVLDLLHDALVVEVHGHLRIPYAAFLEAIVPGLEGDAGIARHFGGAADPAQHVELGVLLGADGVEVFDRPDLLVGNQAMIGADAGHVLVLAESTGSVFEDAAVAIRIHIGGRTQAGHDLFFGSPGCTGGWSSEAQPLRAARPAGRPPAWGGAAHEGNGEGMSTPVVVIPAGCGRGRMGHQVWLCLPKLVGMAFCYIISRPVGLTGFSFFVHGMQGRISDAPHTACER